MDCREAEELLPEVAGGELAGARADEARAHAAGCPACAARLSELTLTVELLRRTGNEPLPEGFGLELHRQLAAAGTPERSFWSRLRAALALRPLTAVGLSAGLAALLAIGGTLLVTARAKSSPSPVVAEAPTLHRVPNAKVALVKIDFVAEREIGDVQFEITLPDGLRFVSKGQELAERSFRWQGKLSAGSNSIPIAVRGLRAGKYRVIAHAVAADLDVMHEVILEVTT